MTPEEQAALDAAESRRKDRELDLKEREVAAKEKEGNASRWSNPVVIGLFAAALGLAGNIIVARVNNQNTQQVEHLHSQSSLILEAIKTNGDTQVACKNLLFFVNLGLLDDERKTIRGVCPKDNGGAPSLPSSGGSSFVDSIDHVTVVVEDDERRAILGARVHIGNPPELCISGVAGLCPLRIRPDLSIVHLTVEEEGYISQEKDVPAVPFILITLHKR